MAAAILVGCLKATVVLGFGVSSFITIIGLGGLLGFASVIEGNLLAEDDRWRRLQLLAARMVDVEWIRSLPKAESHAHLECIEDAYLRDLAEGTGREYPETPTDFDAFLEHLNVRCSFVQTEAAVAETAYRFAKRAAESGIRYSDVIFNLNHWDPWREKLPQFVAALDDGFTQAEAEGLPPARMCVSVSRHQSREAATGVVAQLLDLAHPRVVALSVDGNETRAGMTGKRFAPAFEKARRAGLKTTAHTGESGGAQHIWDTLRHIRPHRIDHGFRAAEDPALVTELARIGIGLNIAPSANLFLRWCPDLASHPLETLRRAGVNVSIHTDDPMQFKLVDEYATAAAQWDWSQAEVRQVAKNSIQTSFAPETLKADLLRELDDFPD